MSILSKQALTASSAASPPIANLTPTTQSKLNHESLVLKSSVKPSLGCQTGCLNPEWLLLKAYWNPEPIALESSVKPICGCRPGSVSHESMVFESSVKPKKALVAELSD